MLGLMPCTTLKIRWISQGSSFTADSKLEVQEPKGSNRQGERQCNCKMPNQAGYEGVGAQGALETGQVTENLSRNMWLPIQNSL